MTVTVNKASSGGMMVIDVVGAAAATAGGIGAVLNPEGVDLLITRTYLYFATGSTGAANLTWGIGATATTASDDICDAFAVITGTVGANAYYMQTASAEQIEELIIWEAGEYLVVSGSATTVGLAGKFFVEYVRLED